MSTPLTIGVHFDLICPWCFIGKRHFENARKRFAQAYPDVVVERLWHPVQLLPDVPQQGLPFAEFYERRLGSPEAVRQRKQQVAQAALRAGLELDLGRISRMPSTTRAHRLLRRVAALGDVHLYETLLDRLFAAYFQRGEDIGDAATLQALAAQVGVPAEPYAATMTDACATLPAAPSNPVPHFVFNGREFVSGAQDAAILLKAMVRATLAPA